VYPETNAGIWFVVFWLPFNISFLALYMGNLARYYLMITEWNTKRVFNQYNAKSSPDARPEPRDSAESENSDSENGSIRSMKDVIQYTLQTLAVDAGTLGDKKVDVVSSLGCLSDTFMMQSSLGHSAIFNDSSVRRPSFALMVLVQERFANIIASEIASVKTDFEIKDATAVVRVSSLNEIEKRWFVPLGARVAFRSVAFEALVLFGEKKLLSHGAGALFELSPFEFYEMFCPLLAAFEDSGTMEGWLAKTEKRASVQFPREIL